MDGAPQYLQDRSIIDWFKDLDNISSNQTNTENTNGDGLVTTIIIGFVVGTIFVILFSIIRDYFPQNFKPKVHDPDAEIPEEKRFWGWMINTANYPEQKILEKVGLDAVVYLRFLKFSMILLFVISIIGNLIILPVNTRGRNRYLPSNSTDFVKGIDIYSMSNIEQGSSLLWVHLISVIVFSAIIQYYIYRLYTSYIEIDNTVTRSEGVKARTVLVTGLPVSIRSDKDLHFWFAELFGKRKIHQAMLIPKLDALAALQAERNIHIKEYKRYLHKMGRRVPDSRHSSSNSQFNLSALDSSTNLKRDEFLENGGNIRMHKSHHGSYGSTDSSVVGAPSERRIYHFSGGIFPFKQCANCCVGCFKGHAREPNEESALVGKKVDSLRHCREKIEKQDQAIRMLQHEDYVKSNYTNIGLVCFDSLATAMEAQQTLLTDNPTSTHVIKAPHPFDIVWHYLTASKWELGVRRVVVYLLIILLFLFWSIPIAIITAWSNLDSLKRIKELQGLVTWVESNATLGPLVSEFLPSLAFTIFLVILPYLLRFMLGFSGYPLYTRAERRLVRVYWLFLFLNSFTLTLITGSLVTVFADIVEHPAEFPSLLARSLPTQATYFANSIIIQGFTGYPIFWLGRFDEFLVCKFKHFFSSKTPAERREAEAPAPFDFGILYSRELFVLLIALIYSTMSPYVVPFACSYFAISFLSARYNFIYVQKPKYQGTRITLLAIHRVSATLLIYQIAMIGVFALKEFPAGIIVTFMAVITIVEMVYARRRFHRPLFFYPLNRCPSRYEDEPIPLKEQDRRKFKELFTHPALTPPDEKHLTEAAGVSRLSNSMQQKKFRMRRDKIHVVVDYGPENTETTNSSESEDEEEHSAFSDSDEEISRNSPVRNSRKSLDENLAMSGNFQELNELYRNEIKSSDVSSK